MCHYENKVYKSGPGFRVEFRRIHSKWRRLVWTITCKSIDSLESLDFWSDVGLDVILPPQSARIASYISTLAPGYARRGVRIVYHEGDIGNRRLIRNIVMIDMYNWLEFSPMPPARTPAPGQTVKPATAALTPVAISTSYSAESIATTSSIAYVTPSVVFAHQPHIQPPIGSAASNQTGSCTIVSPHSPSHHQFQMVISTLPVPPLASVRINGNVSEAVVIDQPGSETPVLKFCSGCRFSLTNIPGLPSLTFVLLVDFLQYLPACPLRLHDNKQL